MNQTPENSAQSLPRKIQTFFQMGIFVSLVGVCFSGYSLYHHLQVKSQGGSTDAFCNINSSVSCDKVAASIYSEIFGVPLGVLGIGFFLSLLVFYFSGLTRRPSAEENIPAANVLALIGVVSSAVLAVISITKVGSVCLVCVGIYLSCVFLFINAFIHRKLAAEVFPFSVNAAAKGSFTSAIIVALCIGIFQVSKPVAKLPNEMLDLPGRQTDFSKKMKPLDLGISKSDYVGLGEDYRKGSDTAKVTIVEFADYQCPGCGVMAKVLERLTNNFKDKILLVFKNFPLDKSCNSAMQNPIHPFACDIAKIARCAGRYGHFWDFHQLAFEKQADASLENAKSWGKSAGLRADQIEECLSSPDILNKIKDDISIANRVGINGTPELFINNKKYIGNRDFETLKTFLENLL